MVSPFAPLIGQDQAVELLTQAISRDRIAPAYLFAGPAGVGRGLAARCFVEAVLMAQSVHRTQHPDLLWVEPTYLHQGKRLTVTEAIAAGLKRKAAPQIRLEQVREIGQFLSRPPLEANRSLVVLEQAETMAEAAANGLLKTLEEPGRATLILIAPGVEVLLPTLVSRCQRIPFHRLSQTAMAQVLRQTGYETLLDLPEMMALAQGSPGAAIAHWQQLQAIPAELMQMLQQPPASMRAALDLARQIQATLDTEAQIWLIDYLQQRYWQAAAESRYPARGLQILEKARQQLMSYAQPRLVWEVTLLALQV